MPTSPAELSVLCEVHNDKRRVAACCDCCCRCCSPASLLMCSALFTVCPILPLKHSRLQVVSSTSSW